MQNKCKQQIDSKQSELDICKAKHEKELAEHMRQETLACVTEEDELGQTIRILEDMRIAKEQYANLNEMAMKQQFMEEEDKEITSQLSISKPLVTEMLQFLYSKSNKGEATGEMTKLIFDIQASLRECITSADQFTKTAHYDAGVSSPQFKSLNTKSKGKHEGLGTDQFHKLIDD